MPASDKLPQELAEIADLIGLPLALVLAKNCRGTRIYIPRQPREGSLLVSLVGMEAALALAEFYATAKSGSEVQVPLGPASEYMARRKAEREQVYKLIDEGMGTTELALRLGITRRGAQQRIKKWRRHRARLDAARARRNEATA